MKQQNRLRSAAAALTATVALGFAASSAHAQGTPINASSPLSGTVISTHMDTNADGLTVGKQTMTILSGPLGRSSIEILDEFALAGEGTCANGNPGTLFTLLVAPNTPAAAVQRFEQSGDLLFLSETSGRACLDSTTNTGFIEAAGSITGGTGGLAGATGSFALHITANTLFSDNVDYFGPQWGTFDQTISLPR